MKRAGPGWLLLALAGLAAVVGAFLPFYTYADGIDVTVWSRGLFPTATLIPLLGVVVGVEAAFALIRGHEPRSPFLNFTWEQVRLAAGAFMILLALSYLLQDRAGGTLGIGYVLLSASSLATFAGGVLTRRAQLARVPGKEVAAEERRPVIKPALATVSRASSDLVKNVADRGHDMRVRLAERREARAAARKEAAEKAAAQRTEMQAAAARAAAERAAAEKAAAEEAAAANAAAEKAAAAANAAAAAKAAAEQVADEAEEPEERAEPAPPTATVETLPTEPNPPAATLEELPVDESADQPSEEPVPEPAEEPVPEPVPEPAEELVPEPADATKPLDATSPAAVDAEDTEDTEDTAELPVADATATTAAKPDAKTAEQPLVAKLSAMRSDAEPDPTLPPDGKSAGRPGQEQPEEEEREEPEAQERADTGTEVPPSS